MSLLLDEATNASSPECAGGIIEAMMAQPYPAFASRVFLIAQPSVKKDGELPDLKPLAAFGDITVVIETGEAPAFRPGEAYEKVKDRLQDFDAENDFLAWAGGDTLSAVMAGAALVAMGHRRFNWLRWERKRLPDGKRSQHTGQYTPVEVMLF